MKLRDLYQYLFPNKPDVLDINIVNFTRELTYDINFAYLLKILNFTHMDSLPFAGSLPCLSHVKEESEKIRKKFVALNEEYAFFEHGEENQENYLKIYSTLLFYTFAQDKKRDLATLQIQLYYIAYVMMILFYRDDTSLALEKIELYASKTQISLCQRILFFRYIKMPKCGDWYQSSLEHLLQWPMFDLISFFIFVPDIPLSIIKGQNFLEIEDSIILSLLKKKLSPKELTSVFYNMYSESLQLKFIDNLPSETLLALKDTPKEFIKIFRLLREKSQKELLSKSQLLDIVNHVIKGENLFELLRVTSMHFFYDEIIPKIGLSTILQDVHTIQHLKTFIMQMPELYDRQYFLTEIISQDHLINWVNKSDDLLQLLNLLEPKNRLSFLKIHFDALFFNQIITSENHYCILPIIDMLPKQERGDFIAAFISKSIIKNILELPPYYQLWRQLKAKLNQKDIAKIKQDNYSVATIGAKTVLKSIRNELKTHEFTPDLLESTFITMINQTEVVLPYVFLAIVGLLNNASIRNISSETAVQEIKATGRRVYDTCYKTWCCYATHFIHEKSEKEFFFEKFETNESFDESFNPPRTT